MWSDKEAICETIAGHGFGSWCGLKKIFMHRPLWSRLWEPGLIIRVLVGTGIKGAFCASGALLAYIINVHACVLSVVHACIVSIEYMRLKYL